MEDAHSLHLSLPPGVKQGDKNNSAPEQPAGSSMTNIEGDDAPAFFGVFDGHGGSAVAKFTGTTIHERLAALDSYSEQSVKRPLCVV
jgi:protein phosphatase 2C family protein 2/3